jgi:hypothetical protein
MTDPTVNSEFARQLVANAKADRELTRKKRPLLSTYAQRMPIGIQRQLRKAAEKNGITQSEIVIQALKGVLPTLLSTEELQQELLDD